MVVSSKRGLKMQLTSPYPATSSNLIFSLGPIWLAPDLLLQFPSNRGVKIGVYHFLVRR
jgi:hypothetical protein